MLDSSFYSSVWPAMTTPKLLGFVLSVWSTCVLPVWRPTKESNSPKTIWSDRSRKYHKVLKPTAHLAVLKKLNACADVSCDSCYCNILMGKMITIHQYALHAFYTVRICLKITMVSLLLFSRRLCCVESEADVLSYPQTRATETLLWDMWPAYLSGLPTHQA